MSIKEMCSSLRSSVGKQMPPKGQGCLGTPYLRYHKKQDSQERQGGELLMGSLNPIFREVYFVV